MSKNYEVLNELVPKTQELHRAIFDKGYSYGKLDTINEIKAEINGMHRVVSPNLKGTPRDDWAVRWNDCIDVILQVIDKYCTESEA